MKVTKRLILPCILTVGTVSAFTASLVSSSRPTRTSLFGISLDNEKQENHVIINNSDNNMNHHPNQATTTSATPSGPHHHTSPPQQQQPPKQHLRLAFGNTASLLQESDLVGNFGFDPLGLATSEQTLRSYREAEIKHGRLAMVIATFVLGTELYGRVLAEYWGMDLEMVEYDEEYTMMVNLDRVSPTLWGSLLGLMAAIELYAADRRRENAADYFAGNLGFDPASLYPTNLPDQKRAQESELQNGRLAMVGLAVYLWQSIMDSGIVPFEFRVMGLSMMESSSSVAQPPAL